MLKMLRKLGRTEGSEILETAVVLPVLFMFLLGIVWFGRAFQVYATITQAAQRGVTVAARHTCATCGNSLATDGEVNAAVYAVTDASNLDQSLIMPNSPAGPPHCVTISPTGGNCGHRRPPER
jgi:Flp pilus assembly protein TadG